ncbi:MAG: hypothetical protein ACM35F_04005 [Betaproteobacteria bacterium]
MLLRCSGQIRVIPDAAFGFDIAAAMALGAALCCNAAALVELLPAGARLRRDRRHIAARFSQQ